MNDFPGTAESFHCPGNTDSVCSCQKAQVFRGQRELDHHSPWDTGTMLLSNIVQDTVESLFDIRHRQTPYPADEP